MGSWESDLRGCFASRLNSEIELAAELLVGSEAISSGTWGCKLASMGGIRPWFSLLFSSVSASQNARWVMKLSLLQMMGELMS